MQRCVVCEHVISPENVCTSCTLLYDKQWCVGDRDGVLRALIDGMKFERKYAGIDTLTDLLDARLPLLPLNTILVPIPTVRSHVRQRGYDGVREVAVRLAKRRGIATSSQLTRITSTTQRGASKRDRRKQAEQAFTSLPVLREATYIIIDDVITTGATVEAAARALRGAGAETVWIAALARQPLD